MILISAGLHQLCHGDLNLTSSTLVTLTSHPDLDTYKNITDGNVSTCSAINMNTFGNSMLKFLIPANKKVMINIVTQDMECSNKTLYLMREECNTQKCVYYTPCSFMANYTMECDFSETSDFLYLFIRSIAYQNSATSTICQVNMMD